MGNWGIFGMKYGEGLEKPVSNIFAYMEQFPSRIIGRRGISEDQLKGNFRICIGRVLDG
jgi:hypothetical protein